jgi:hypothetical protein
MGDAIAFALNGHPRFGKPLFPGNRAAGNCGPWGVERLKSALFYSAMAAAMILIVHLAIDDGQLKFAWRRRRRRGG